MYEVCDCSGGDDVASAPDLSKLRVSLLLQLRLNLYRAMTALTISRHRTIYYGGTKGRMPLTSICL